MPMVLRGDRSALGGGRHLVFFLGGGGVGGGDCFFWHVPNVFTKTFPIAPHFLSHILWPWFNFHVHISWEVMGKGEVLSLLLSWGREAYLGFYVLEYPIFQKYW